MLSGPERFLEWWRLPRPLDFNARLSVRFLSRRRCQRKVPRPKKKRNSSREAARTPPCCADVQEFQSVEDSRGARDGIGRVSFRYCLRRTAGILADFVLAVFYLLETILC